MAKQISDLVSLDPAEAYSASDLEIVANLYDRLVRFEAEEPSKLTPALATSWSVSEDGKTFEFKLRDDATFQSGAKVTAEDVVFSFKRVVTLNKGPGFILTQLGWT